MWWFNKPKVLIEQYKDANGQFRWRLRSPNGEILGDNYMTRQMRDKTVELLQTCRFRVIRED